MVEIPDQTISGDSLVLNLSEYFDFGSETSPVYRITGKSEPFAISTRIMDNLLVLKSVSSYLSSDITLSGISGSEEKTA